MLAGFQLCSSKPAQHPGVKQAPRHVAEWVMTATALHDRKT